MNEQLTLKELAPYLPYGLKYTFDNVNYWADSKLIYTGTRFELGTLIRLTDTSHTSNVIGIKWDDDKYGLSSFSELRSIYHKPILRPMSDLIGQIGIPSAIENFLRGNGVKRQIDLHYWAIQWLCGENHDNSNFDVFGLIDKGLAIDINTIEL